MIEYLILVPVSYLLGSLPFGIIAGKVFKRVDVREYGSGKTGMTNVLRTVGWPAAALVLLLDMGKAVAAVALSRLFTDSAGVDVACALAALVGHNWPVFVGFRGGRGTATGWGSLFILSPLSGLAATIAGLPVVAITRYVSLGSITGATLGAIALAVLALTGHAPMAYIWFSVPGALIVIFRHWDNIKRLVRGEERKLGQPVKLVEGRGAQQ